MTNSAIDIFEASTIAEYDPFRAQLKELKQGNEKAVFDYESEKGNKEARSHIYKLRQTKGAVEKVRKEKKEASLKYGRLVDSQAKEIISEIEDMIDVHDKPIKAIEQREKDRVAAHEEKIECLSLIFNTDFSQESSGALKLALEDIKSKEPNESFEEFTAPAIKAWKEAKDKIQTALNNRLKYEEEQAELERLRKEQEVRERKEREAEIARQAAEKARIDAENKAKAEQEAAAKREAEARDALERAEKAKLEAEEKAKRDAELAEKRRLDDIAAAERRAKEETEAARKAEEDAAAKREADKKHHARINNEAVDSLLSECPSLDKVLAKEIVTAIAKGLIQNVSIKY